MISKTDPKIYNLIKKEIIRQKNGLSLIASENFASQAVLEAMGTGLSNKYSEGYPGKRYYGGNEFIDQIETIAIERAKKLFKAEHANVQPHSGSQANAAVYLALLNYRDKILGIDLSAGGHLTHGSLVNFSGQLYNFSYYGVDSKTEKVDIREVEKIALRFLPKLIIVSTTAYSRILEFRKFRKIADKVKSYLMADIAHIAGLVTAGLHPHPFPYCDVVTTTTHKTLRGPRGGLILSKIKDRIDPRGKMNLAQKIDKAVFPGIQGGPLDHVIAAKAVCFLEAMKPSFKKYQKQIILNAKAMADEFQKQGIRVVSDGTDNHLMVIDISPFNVGSKLIQDELDKVGIYVNRNAIPFDKRPPYNPSGIRLGSPTITTMGLREKECRQVVKLIVALIKNIETQKIKTEIKKEVKKLVKNYRNCQKRSFRLKSIKMKNIAKIIDQTFLKKGALDEEIKKIAEEAKEYNFRAFCVLPEHTELAKEILKHTDVKVTTLIDEPTGASPTEQRKKMVNKAKIDGSDEIELVMKIDDFKNKKYKEVLEDLEELCPILPTKVIIGSGYLTDQEIKKASEMTKQAKAICVKTATVDDPLDSSELKEKAKHIRIMKETAPGLLIKASGAVRTLADLEIMLAAGADIIGTSSGKEIVDEAHGKEVKETKDNRIVE
ncbi:MAG: deoxyribose-phosphate aldolase [Candidatus Nealsonbacteria bacterium]|nr:deoxyribose-phosphate aldolase [Candidatus Nealsonbacteria bacterium]